MNRHLFIPAIACALLSCSSPTEPTAVASVSVSPTAITVASGATTILSAATLDSKGGALTGRLITWASSDNAIATVSATGVVTAGMNRGGSPSTVTVSASSEGKTGSAAIAVIPVPVSRVSFALDSVRLEPGAEQSPTLSVVDAEGIALTGRNLTWTSTDTLVVKVSPAGVLSAVPYAGAAIREAKVIAVVESKADTLRAIVTPLAVARVLLSPDTVRLLAGATAQFMVVLQDTKATTLTNRSVTLNSQDTLIASASSSDWKLTTTTYLGALTRITRVIAAAEGKADTSVVIVSPVPVHQVAIEGDSIVLAPGMRKQLTAVTRDSTGRGLSDRPVSWLSTDSSTVSVSVSGLVSIPLSLAPIGKRARIIASSSGQSDTVDVSVSSTVNTTLVAGNGHSCSLDVSGTAFCWGSNANGELGDGTTISRGTPAPVSGNFVFKSLAAGNIFTCGLTTLGAAYCWGNNSLGRLGDGTETNRLTPVAVSGGHTFIRLFNSGANHTCGLSVTGDIFCWGYNIWGQLGDGTTTNRSTPVKLKSDVQFVSLTINDFRTCGLTADGTVYCWGSTISGVSEAVVSPTQVPFAERFVQLSLGGERTACGISTNGITKCWGLSSSSLIAGLSPTQLLTIPVSGNRQLTNISLGFSHACGTDVDRNVFCWGRNGAGQLGINKDVAEASSALPVESSLKFLAVASGRQHTCGLTVSSEVVCWGANGFGALGNGIVPSATPPTAVMLDQPFSEIEGGIGRYACGRTSVTAWWCWGTNLAGSFGAGSSVYSGYPLQLAHQSISSIAIGDISSCGIATDGSTYCWGSNEGGFLGTGVSGPSFPTPTPVAGNRKFISVARGHLHSCALDSLQYAYCWGDNSYGQLGDSSITSRITPTPVFTNVRFQSIVTGRSHTCAIDVSGLVYCWGLGSLVGDGSTGGARLVPKRASSDSVFVAIAAGSQHTCGVLRGGAVACWGQEGGLSRGVLGAGDGFNSQLKAVPSLVPSNQSFKSVYVGSYNSCALSVENTAFCWGLNANGQLGDGTMDRRDSPVRIFGGLSLTDMAITNDFLCGRKVSGSVECWGNNSTGNLGSGYPSYLPQLVVKSFFPMLP